MSYSYETNKDSKNFTPAGLAKGIFGYDRIIEGITIHHWGDPDQNPQFDSIVNYLLANGSNTSAHFIATGTNRRVACIVAPGDVAHHSGNAWGNARTIGIELDPRARDEDYDVAAELVADIRSAYGDVPIYWHSYFTATSCPGTWDADRLDKLSYTKYSHVTDWGKGGDVNPKAPTPQPVPPPVTVPTPGAPLYRLIIDGKQVAAYSAEANAYKGYVQYGKKGTITLNGADVTAQLIAKYIEKSPTTGQPDSGKPVTEKHDYSEENNGLLKTILALLQSLVSKFTNIFK